MTWQAATAAGEWSGAVAACENATATVAGRSAFDVLLSAGLRAARAAADAGDAATAASLPWRTRAAACDEVAAAVSRRSALDAQLGAGSWRATAAVGHAALVRDAAAAARERPDTRAADAREASATVALGAAAVRVIAARLRGARDAGARGAARGETAAAVALLAAGSGEVRAGFGDADAAAALVWHRAAAAGLRIGTRAAVELTTATVTLWTAGRAELRAGLRDARRTSAPTGP